MKINWAHLFSDRALERGWAYYCDDKILDVSRNGDTYDAYVIGSDFYPVEITVKGSKISRMKCGCPYAEEGHRCKHMAAVLYELEERGALDTEEDEDSTRDDGGKNKKASGRTVNRYSRLQGTQMKTPAAAVHPATGTDIMIWAR